MRGLRGAQAREQRRGLRLGFPAAQLGDTWLPARLCPHAVRFREIALRVQGFPLLADGVQAARSP